MTFAYASRDGRIRDTLREKNIEFHPLAEMSVSEFVRVIEEYQPDVIHAHDRSASLLCAKALKKLKKTKEIPIIVHMHVNNNRGLKLFLKNLVWTFYARYFKHIFWVSKSSLSGFQFKPFLKGKSSVLYNALDGNATRASAEESAPDKNYDVIYVGRLTYQKNPERLMKILNEVCKGKSDICCAIAGDGPKFEYVKRFVEENNLSSNIDCLGYVESPLGLIKNSKLLLMTSRFEGTPMVAIEAQVLGTPIVSTPVDGMCEIVSDDINGYLSDSDEALSSHIIDIASDGELRARLSSGSYEASTIFTDTEHFLSEIKKEYFKAQK